jgi:hypothetical protein
VDKVGEDIAGEELFEPQVVYPENLVEDSLLIQSSFGHQKMEGRVEIQKTDFFSPASPISRMCLWAP